MVHWTDGRYHSLLAIDIRISIDKHRHQFNKVLQAVIKEDKKK